MLAPGGGNLWTGSADEIESLAAPFKSGRLPRRQHDRQRRGNDDLRSGRRCSPVRISQPGVDGLARSPYSRASQHDA